MRIHPHQPEENLNYRGLPSSRHLFESFESSNEFFVRIFPQKHVHRCEADVRAKERFRFDSADALHLAAVADLPT
jgi:hypothetical protein